MQTRYFSNNSSTTIVSDNGATIVVASTAAFPVQFPFYVTAENASLSREVIKVNGAIDAVTWSVTRAQEGTTQIAFSAGNKIEQRVTAGFLNDVVLGVNGAVTKSGDTLSGSLFEKSNSVAATDIDVSTGSLFFKTVTATTTFTVSNIPASGSVASFVLELTNGGSQTVNWWSGIKWPGGTSPNLTVSGIDILGFYTRDAGVTWRGMILAKDSK